MQMKLILIGIGITKIYNAGILDPDSVPDPEKNLEKHPMHKSMTLIFYSESYEIDQPEIKRSIIVISDGRSTSGES